MGEGIVRQGLHERVTGELGVALPLEGVVGKAQALEIARQVFEREALLAGELAQVLPLHLARDALVEHRHVHDQGRHANAGRRASVDLVVQHAALCVIRGQNPQGGRREV